MNLFFRFWFFVLAYMGLIFYLSSQPQFPIPMPEWVYYFDKTVHAALFGFLSFLFLRAWLQGDWHTITIQTVGIAILFTLLYGISDEFHQSFVPGRTPDPMDVLADTLGAFFVSGSLFLYFRHAPMEEREI